MGDKVWGTVNEVGQGRLGVILMEGKGSVYWRNENIKKGRVFRVTKYGVNKQTN